MAGLGFYLFGGEVEADLVVDLQRPGLLSFSGAGTGVGVGRLYLFGHAYFYEVDALDQILLLGLGLHVALEVVVLLLEAPVHLALLLQHLPQLLDLPHHLFVVKALLLLGLEGRLLLQLYAEAFVAVPLGGDQSGVCAALGGVALDVALSVAVVVYVVV